MQHIDLQGNKWYTLSILEQMANIGSEIERAIKWKSKKRGDYAKLANLRALELFDLTLADRRHKTGLKEITRARELWLDFFIGENQYHQTNGQWRKYFNFFAFAARSS